MIVNQILCGNCVENKTLPMLMFLCNNLFCGCKTKAIVIVSENKHKHKF